jgi:hypothetical protein
MKEGRGKISLVASLTVIMRDDGGEHPAMAGHTHLADLRTAGSALVFRGD